jgi:hypothetical protein
MVIRPGPGPHRRARVGDVMLLLLDVLVAYRQGQRLIVFDPLASVGQCEFCEVAYRRAHQAIDEAGGVASLAATVLP